MNNDEPLANTTFDLVGKAHYWGMRRGCVCTSSKYAAARRESCSTMELRDYCKDVPYFPATSYEVLDSSNKVLCARREGDLSILNMRKPKKVDGKWSCAHHPNNKKLCGNADEERDYRVHCVRQGLNCPITDVYFEDGQLKYSRDSSKGNPITDLVVEQGPPCIDYKVHHNAIVTPKKQFHMLYPDEYFEGCPKISFGEKEFTTSPLFRQVQGFK